MENAFVVEGRGRITSLVWAMLSLRCWVEGPQDHAQVQWFPRMYGTQKSYCTHSYSLLQQMKKSR